MRAVRGQRWEPAEIGKRAALRDEDGIGILVDESTEAPVEVVFVDGQAEGKILAVHVMRHQPYPQGPPVKEDGTSLLMMLLRDFEELQGLTHRQIVDGYRFDGSAFVPK